MCMHLHAGKENTQPSTCEAEEEEEKEEEDEKEGALHQGHFRFI